MEAMLNDRGFLSFSDKKEVFAFDLALFNPGCPMK